MRNKYFRGFSDKAVNVLVLHVMCLHCLQNKSYRNTATRTLQPGCGMAGEWLLDGDQPIPEIKQGWPWEAEK